MFTITKRKLYFNINNEYIESLCDKYAVNIPEEWKQKRLERDGPHYHVTICDLDSMNVQLPLKKDLEIHGFYQSEEHAFLKLKWPKAEQFRKKYNNDDIVLHITLGFNNSNYTQPTKTLIYPDRDRIFVYNHTVVMKNFCFYTTTGFVHKVDCDACQIHDIPKFMKQTNSRVFIKQYLGNLGPNEKIEVCRVNNLLEQPRHISIVNSNNQGLLSEYKMVYASIPPNFSKVHDNLFISGSIHTKQHRDYLKHMGITTVITLLDWKLTSLDKYFEYYQFPTVDLTSPSLRDIHEIHRLIDRPGHKTLVHCRGGKGRSAVVMFTYLISKRFDQCPDLYLRHIKRVVAKKRITLLSPSQQSFVDKFNLHHVHLFYLMDIMNGLSFEGIKDLLKKEYSARVKQKDNLIIVSYNLIKTKFYKVGALALRGTIFKMNTNGLFENKLENVVCLPYYKFFNIGELYSYKADFDQIEEIEQKIDGSLIKLFYHNGWNVGTNNTLDAYECPLGRTSNTFGSLFDKIKTQYSDFNVDSLNKNYIYCLEIVSPLNRVVLKYNDEYQLYHLLTRDMTTLEEIRDDIGLPKPERYSFKDDLELLHFNKMETEGFVVRYENNYRVKVKTAWYLDQHRKSSDLFDRTSPKYLLECLLHNTIDDIIGRYPDVKEPLDKVKTLLDRYETEFTEFITKHNLTSPVEDEKRIELFKSKIIQSIENAFLRKMISKYITNKINDPFQITNGYSQFLECYT